MNDSKKFLLFIITGLLFCLPVFSFAQAGVTGTVTSAADKTPISGASVIIKEQNKGVQTDANGHFLVTLTAKNGGETKSFTDTVNILGPNIKVDGDFADWQYVDYSFQNSETYAGTLRAVKTFASADAIYFYLEGTADMKLEIFDLYIDADNNTATGYSTWMYPSGSGLEYLLEGAPADGSVFQHSGAPTAWAFSPVASFSDAMRFSEIKPVSGKKVVEFSVKKSVLGSMSGFVNFALIENNAAWAPIGAMPESAKPGSKFIAVQL